MAPDPDSNEATADVAIVGMIGRFPGAPDLQAFWRNLEQGVESISHFTDEELEPSRLETPGIRSLPAYVKARGVMEDADKFDAAFFGIPPLEASVMDPQHRVFLEGAWAALENAGYDVAEYRGLVGIWAGMSNAGYLFENVLPRRDVVEEAGYLQVMLANEKDYLTTRVSYKLNLRGPSVNVYTACSTSLVAVSHAYQALLSHQCDIALAGGISISAPQRRGYVYQEGGIASPDGHCRPFDAAAAGTLSGDGLGIVVLKRLDEALQDGDTVHAVIRGAAVNNDGSVKASFTAPSVDGQAEVIVMAQAMADVDPRSISYVEAHGTATPLGDPIEVAALTQAFRAATDERGFCALGALKSNIGHLDAAAGVAGLIKTVLALEHRMLPPTLHFTRPNPKIDFANSPFVVNAKLLPWSAGASPRRAGVSSFGIGGTNAHVVLEEAPGHAPTRASRDEQLLVLSARTEVALRRAAVNLARHLRSLGDTSLADVAYTLQVGRRSFARRLAVVGGDAAQLGSLLEAGDGASVLIGNGERPRTKVVFFFPGEASPHTLLGTGLYRSEPVFRAEIDACAQALLPHLQIDIRSLLDPEPANRSEAERRLGEPGIAQPVLFALEHALSRLWMSWGVTPVAMIGAGLGEYVAACLAGVLTRDDAAVVVAARGRAMQEHPEGFGGDTGGLAPLREAVAKTRLLPSRLPWISSLTGDWITPEQAMDPHYWVEQARQPARLEPGLGRLAIDESQVLLEVGPGRTLSTLLRRETGRSSAELVVASLGTEGGSQVSALLEAAGRLWSAGVPIDWVGHHAHERRRRVPLPTYAFERKRYWIDALPLQEQTAGDFEAADSLPAADHGPAPSPGDSVVEHAETDVGARLRAVLAKASGIPAPELDPSRTFLELGFDSLLLTQVSGAIKRTFKTQVTFRQLLETVPTMAALASYLEARQGSTGGTEPPPSAGGPSPVAGLPAVPPVPGARLGRDAAGNEAWFVPDPERPGKYLKVTTP
jgi:acyl transferase domain-containing protein